MKYFYYIFFACFPEDPEAEIMLSSTMEIIITNNVSFPLEEAKASFNSSHIDYLVEMLSSLSLDIRSSSLRVMKKIILGVSEKDVVFNSDFKKVFDSLLGLLLSTISDVMENSVCIEAQKSILELTLLNIYNLMVKLRQLKEFNLSWFKYIILQAESFKIILLSNLSDILLLKAKDQELVKLHCVLVLSELSSLHSTTLNRNMDQLGITSIILKNMSYSVNIVKSCLAKSDNEVVPKLSSDVEKLTYLLIKNSLSYLNNILLEKFESSAANTSKTIKAIQEIISLNQEKFDCQIVELVCRLYSSPSTTEADRKTIIKSSLIMKHCKKILYISGGHQMRKLEAVITFINKIVYHNNPDDLAILHELDLGAILIQILTERLVQDKIYDENISIKFNIMGILGRLVLASTDLFDLLAEENILITMLIDDYLGSGNLKFQQCVSFFLNNVMVASECIRNEKSRAFFKLVYLDKLPSLISKINLILEENKHLSKSATEEDAVIISMVQTSLFQILHSIVKNGTLFDKFQCIQYSCFLSFMDLLKFTTLCQSNNNKAIQENQSVMISLALRGVRYLIDEYIWLITETSDSTSCCQYDSKIPKINDIVKVLLDHYHISRQDNCPTTEAVIQSIMNRLP